MIFIFLDLRSVRISFGFVHHRIALRKEFIYGDIQILMLGLQKYTPWIMILLRKRNMHHDGQRCHKEIQIIELTTTWNHKGVKCTQTEVEGHKTRSTEKFFSAETRFISKPTWMSIVFMRCLGQWVSYFNWQMGKQFNHCCPSIILGGWELSSFLVNNFPFSIYTWPRFFTMLA